MTVSECIAAFDGQTRNQLSSAVKTKWLEELDLRIYDDLLTGRNVKDAPSVPYGGATVLLADGPYTDVYAFHLARKRDLALGDVERYNNDTALFASAYSDYADHISRSFGKKRAVRYFNI